MYWLQDNSVFQYSNANDMRVIQDFTDHDLVKKRFGPMIADHDLVKKR
jgi:hypothetical protein